MINLQTEIPVFAANDITTPLHRLADQLKAHPVYSQFMTSYRAMQADTTAQNLLEELRARQYQGSDEAGYDRLLQQFYVQPSVKAYQAAEETLHDLFLEIDTIISETTGIAFAANAKRSCCGG